MTTEQPSDFDRKLDRIADKIETLTDQVGRFTEGLTEFRSEMIQQFNRLAQTAERQEQRLDRLGETAERQERNIERLAATVERQAQIVERLLERQ